MEEIINQTDFKIDDGDNFDDEMEDVNEGFIDENRFSFIYNKRNHQRVLMNSSFLSDLDIVAPLN